MPITINHAIAASSSMTGFKDANNGFRVCISQGNIVKRHPAQDTTQSGDSDTYNTPPNTDVTSAVLRATKRYVFMISGTGFFETSADAGTTWDKEYATSAGAALSGAIHARVSRATIARNMQLINVTATNDPVPQTVFSWGKVAYSGSLDGYLLNTETPLDDNPNDPIATISLPTGTGSISGDVVFDDENQVMDFNGGGPHRFVTPYYLSGPITRTNSPFEIICWDINADLDNGQTLTGQVLCQQMQMELDYRTAGVIPVSFSGVVSGATLT